MSAVKRMYDNSYNQRQETVEAAKAYLDEPVVVTENKHEKKIKQAKHGKACSVIGIVYSTCYCLLIFGLMLIPLIQETELHKIKVEISQHKNEIERLESEIQNVTGLIYSKREFISIEDTARNVLHLVDYDDSSNMRLAPTKYVTLDEARDAYYNPKIEYISNAGIESID